MMRMEMIYMMPEKDHGEWLTERITVVTEQIVHYFKG